MLTEICYSKICDLKLSPACRNRHLSVGSQAQEADESGRQYPISWNQWGSFGGCSIIATAIEGNIRKQPKEECKFLVNLPHLS